MKAELEDQQSGAGATPSSSRRNLDSAEEYERLAKTVKDIPDDLLVAYSEAFEDAPDTECWQEMLKDIFRGFFGPADATELVQAFLDRKRDEA
jgi:hypothetical protein